MSNLRPEFYTVSNTHDDRVNGNFARSWKRARVPFCLAGDGLRTTRLISNGLAHIIFYEKALRVRQRRRRYGSWLPDRHCWNPVS
jgi:hypothetical protein